MEQKTITYKVKFTTSNKYLPSPRFIRKILEKYTACGVTLTKED